MGPIWGRQDPDGPYVGPMNFAIWAVVSQHKGPLKQNFHYFLIINLYKLLNKPSRSQWNKSSQCPHYSNAYDVLYYTPMGKLWVIFCAKHFYMAICREFSRLSHMPRSIAIYHTIEWYISQFNWPDCYTWGCPLDLVNGCPQLDKGFLVCEYDQVPVEWSGQPLDMRVPFYYRKSQLGFYEKVWNEIRWWKI